MLSALLEIVASKWDMSYVYGISSSKCFVIVVVVALLIYLKGS